MPDWSHETIAERVLRDPSFREGLRAAAEVTTGHASASLTRLAAGEAPEPFGLERVREWRAERERGVIINGAPFPFAVLTTGPMVEPIEFTERFHILWLPLLAHGPAPRAGRPNGQTVAVGGEQP